MKTRPLNNSKKTSRRGDRRNKRIYFFKSTKKPCIIDQANLTNKIAQKIYRIQSRREPLIRNRIFHTNHFLLSFVFLPIEQLLKTKVKTGEPSRSDHTNNEGIHIQNIADFISHTPSKDDYQETKNNMCHRMSQEGINFNNKFTH